MTFDRAATLRHAEKLVRQGKVDAAIAAYAQVVEHQPTDWNTANMLGDLYARAGRPDRAVEQFVRSADRLVVEGFGAKAAALYKKILKLKPDDERALAQAAELSAAQGLYVDARAYLASLADHRSARGDAAGAADARIRIETVDPSDYDRRIQGARLRAEGGNTEAGVAELKEIAREAQRKNRAASSAAALELAIQLAPGQEDVRAQLVQAAVAGGDFARARAHATTVPELTALANALEANGRRDEATDTLQQLARLMPHDRDLALRIARAFMDRGDVAAALPYITEETARVEPDLVLAAADLQLRAGKFDEGLAQVRRYLHDEPDGRERIALLSCRLANQMPEAGFRALEAAAEEAASRNDFMWAAAALQEFVRCAPAYVPALLRLVEVCVDGGLDTILFNAQVMLTDAYLAAGSGAEARFIAEDLVDREPWVGEHVDRLRRALVLMHEPDPDLVIASHLSAPPRPDAELAAVDRTNDDPVEPEADSPAPLQPALQVVERRAEVRAPAPDDPQFALGPNAIDIGDILEELESVSTGPATQDIDLSMVLNELKPIEAPDLDTVFEQLRDEVSSASDGRAAEADYQRGLALIQAGDVDGCLTPLQSAARSSSRRFAASAMLGRIFKQRGDLAESIEWFERAAETDAPSTPEAHALLYDLADALQGAGEQARALAVWLELQADAGAYRDVAERIDRLARTGARG